MLRAAQYLDTHYEEYPKVDISNKSSLCFLFCIVPRFVLFSFSEDLIDIINSTLYFGSTFLPYICEDATLFTSWLTAGLDLFCRDLSACSNPETFKTLSVFLNQINRPCEAFTSCKESDIVHLMKYCVRDHECLESAKQLIPNDLVAMFCVVFGPPSLAESVVPSIPQKQLRKLCQRCFFYNQIVEI